MASGQGSPRTGGSLELVDANERPAQPALDLHEGISDPLAREGALGEGFELAGCARWPEHLRLANLSSGELVRGRCRATNLCRYCQRLYVVETVEMLTLDALENAPTLWAVLTAREHLTRRDTYRHLERLREAARRRWGDYEHFVQVEFQRRGALHLNLLIKGVPVEDEDELRAVLVDRWCARVDARPVGQWVAPIEDAGGVVRYLSKMLAHGLKAEQAPPIGWRGHRTSQTRGYLVRPAGVMREEAKRSLRLKRLLHRGVPGEVAELELALAEAETWELVSIVDAGGVDQAQELKRDARRPFELDRSSLPGDRSRALERESTATGEPARGDCPSPQPRRGRPTSGASSTRPPGATRGRA